MRAMSLLDPVLMERRRVHFAGYVQGVGFRYTACRIARRYAVSGFVQNLSDGRVVVVAEGVSAELDRFLADLREVMADYIRGVETETSPATGEYQGFGIRY